MENKFIVLFFVFIFSSVFVMAQGLGPGVPHQFYGTATYNGAAATGMAVDAYIEGEKVGSTDTSNGIYGYSPIFLIKDPEGMYEDETIIFYLNGVDTGQTFIFENGASTKLDLSATGSTSPPSNDGDTGGGGPSGGGPSGGSPSGGSVCVEDWQCNAWSDLSGACGTRTCTDAEKCGTTKLKPTVRRDCKEEPETGMITIEDEQEGGTGITGAVIGRLGKAGSIGVFIFIIAVVAILIFIIVMKRKEEEKK